ncbi:hypothetical protein RHGRI_020812 [Rhododendron griersonianum]|uniref:Uncharacterized protein n=1 Tax=Rhododendron griersonianum TaxID=479676 RepID=A0AAV6JHX5_9ERIC|nr:hypothetical protein RHGRI_020812 [Rhododendron griersonianum]
MQSALVQKLLASASNDVISCPYLANLEIERRKFLFGKGDDEKLVEALMQYYCRFGYLACFASDIEVFLEVLPRDKETLLLKKLLETFEPPATMLTKALGQLLTLLKIQESVGNFFTPSASDSIENSEFSRPINLYVSDSSGKDESIGK